MGYTIQVKVWATDIELERSCVGTEVLGSSSSGGRPGGVEVAVVRSGGNVWLLVNCRMSPAKRDREQKPKTKRRKQKD